MGDEYPKALYRDGTELDVNGVHVDSRVVTDADDELAALEEGWRVAMIASPKTKRTA